MVEVRFFVLFSSTDRDNRAVFGSLNLETNDIVLVQLLLKINVFLDFCKMEVSIIYLFDLGLKVLADFQKKRTSRSRHIGR